MSNLRNSEIRGVFHSRSSSVSLGTSSLTGEVNIAPVGSAFMPDDKSIVLLRGPLQQTYENLRANPKAVFMVVNNSPRRWMWFFLTGNFRASFGYRVYATLREEKALKGPDREKVVKEDPREGGPVPHTPVTFLRT